MQEFGSGNENWFDPVVSELAEGVVRVAVDWTILQINPAAVVFTSSLTEPLDETSGAEPVQGRMPSQAQDHNPQPESAFNGKPYDAIFSPESYDLTQALQETLQQQQSLPTRTGNLPARDSQTIPVRIRTVFLPASSNSSSQGGEQAQAIAIIENLHEQSVLQAQLEEQYELLDLIGKSPALRRLQTILPDIAQSDSLVLIEGPRGSGKTLVARILHELSSRKRKPCESVVCGDMPDTLLEPELFGYVKNAFPAATRDKPGAFARAKNGTLILEDLGGISTALQVRLLRSIQERTFEPMGSYSPIQSDVRLIVTSSTPLAESVRRGQFRDDLYYRLNIIRLELPPLLLRREDIPLLVKKLLQRTGARTGKVIRTVAPDAMQMLLNYSYPGNVRELENILEYAMVLTHSPILTPELLPPEVRQASGLGAAMQAQPIPGALQQQPGFPQPAFQAIQPQSGALTPLTAGMGISPLHPSFDTQTGKGQITLSTNDPLEQAEAQALLAILTRHDGNRTTAAEELGIDKSTLWRKMKKLGVEYHTRRGRKS